MLFFKIKYNEDSRLKLIGTLFVDKIFDFECYHVLNLNLKKKTFLRPKAKLSTSFWISLV